MRIFNLGKKRTEESIKKQSDTWKTKYKRGYISPVIGHKHTEEFKQKMAKVMKGKLPVRYFDTNEKISKTIKNKEICKGVNNPKFSGYYKFFHHIHGEVVSTRFDLVRKYNLVGSCIDKLCRKERNSHKGWNLIDKIN